MLVGLFSCNSLKDGIVLQSFNTFNGNIMMVMMKNRHGCWLIHTVVLEAIYKCFMEKNCNKFDILKICVCTCNAMKQAMKFITRNNYLHQRAVYFFMEH